MTESELKRKLRELKRLEITIRFGAGGSDASRPSDQPAGELVWHRFFSVDGRSGGVRYPFSVLRILDHESRKRIVEEYLTSVYFRKYAEQGMSPAVGHDPELLSFLGLPVTATLPEIRSRFRELAHLYHPDHGGDVLRMVELLERYHSFSTGRQT